MAELDDAEDDTAARGRLHELHVDIDRVGLWEIGVFGSEVRARSGEYQGDCKASVGVSWAFAVSYDGFCNGCC